MNSLLMIIFNLIVGSSILIYGVKWMGEGLENANSDVIKKVFSRCTRTVGSSFLTGTLCTALVQSSTAVTVLTVGFVNGGMMSLSQAVGIIYGANIGTTITAQLMSFNIINTKILIPIILLSILIWGISKNRSLQSLAQSFIGFGMMFIGIKVLNLSIPYIKASKELFEFCKLYGQNIYICLVIGMLTTMLVHSSSATIGLTIVLFNAHLIPFEGAVGLTLGDNIGTCITAQMASLRANKAAQRTAWAHTIYNIIGVLIALIFLPLFEKLVTYYTLYLGQDESRIIANTHTLFNILSAVLFLPLSRYYVQFIEKLIPDH